MGLLHQLHELIVPTSLIWNLTILALTPVVLLLVIYLTVVPNVIKVFGSPSCVLDVFTYTNYL